MATVLVTHRTTWMLPVVASGGITGHKTIHTSVGTVALLTNPPISAVVL